MLTTIDKILGGRVWLCQPKQGYRVAMDSVLLAAAIPAQPGDRVLDLGVGTGAVSFCLLARVPGVQMVGIDNNPEHLALARDGLARNHRFADALHLLEGDIAAISQGGTPALAAGTFDYVVANPPYHPHAAYAPSPYASKNAGHAGQDLAAWVKAACHALKPGGWFYSIFPQHAHTPWLQAVQAQFNQVRLKPLLAKASGGKHRVLIAASNQPLPGCYQVTPFILHEETGGYTPQGQAVLWEMAAIAMD